MTARPDASCRLALGRTGRLLADRAVLAASWGSRLVGLLSRRSLSEGEGMVFPACRSIHTLGMRFAIDVLFVDRDWRVVAMKPGLKPWRLAGPIRGAWAAIELPAGVLQRCGVRLSDGVEIRPDP